jgi:hypothetical protein
VQLSQLDHQPPSVASIVAEELNDARCASFNAFDAHFGAWLCSNMLWMIAGNM